MDNLKEKIEEVVAKVKNDPNFEERFKKKPVKALEEVIGIDLPDDKINEMVTAIQTKIKLDDSGILGKIKGLFD